MIWSSSLWENVFRPFVFKSFLSGAFVSFVCLAAQTTNAATFTVSNADDSGFGSLRQAILDANNIPGDDEIVFSGFFDSPRTITLLGGHLEIMDGLAITGKGVNLLTISGNNQWRVFYVHTAATPVILSGMTITAGRAGDGAGIKNTVNLTLTGVNVNGNNALSDPAQGGGIWNSGTLTLNGSIVSSNVANNGCPNFQNCNYTMNHGGGIYNAATATLNNSTVSGNLTTSRGGGIMTDDSAHTILNNSTLSNNTVTADGGYDTNGGGILAYGRMTITASTVSGNTPNGIVILASTNEPATITNSTIAGNYGNTNGAGISVGACGNYNLNLCGVLNLTNSTVTGNHSQRSGSGEDGGGGIYCVSPYCTLNNSIVAGNIHNGGNRVDVYAAYRDFTPDNTDARFSGSYNLIGRGDGECGNASGTCGIDNGASNNQVGSNAAPLDARFSPAGLQFNGGATQTVALRFDSPAIDKGNATGTDQRGVQRPFDYDSKPNASNGADIGAFESGVFIVNSLLDTADNSAGDGACGDGANCSLRAAIQEVNAAGAGKINFNLPGSGMQTIQLASALPALNGKITLAGPGADKLTIRRNATARFRIFTVFQTVTISGMTIANGYGEGYGGGVLGEIDSHLTLDGVVISGNRVYPWDSFMEPAGGGVYQKSYYALIIKNSAISGNIAEGNKAYGGGVAKHAGGYDELTVINSTISGNVARYGGGISHGHETASIINSTVAFNSASSTGGGIYKIVSSGIVNLKNSIVSDNAAPTAPDISGAIVSQGFNLVQNRTGSSGLNSTTDLPGGTNPRLNPALALNGGTTLTHALEQNSPAIDKGSAASGITTDQRGMNRVDLAQIPNNPAGGGDGSDIGAFEIQEIWNSLTVTKTADTNDNSCTAADCSLREAVAAANATTQAEIINFAIPANDSGCNSSTSVCTITLTLGSEIVINGAGGAITINGTGANVLTVNADDGVNRPRIFYSDGARLTIENIKLINGSGNSENAPGQGGAIYAQGGTLVLRGVEINGNSASFGGGVYFNGGADHQIFNSTISGNSTFRTCGGFDNEGGTLSITNSTISGNRSTFYLGGTGGGFCNSGQVILRNVTVTSNESTTGGGGINNFGGTLNLGNTIIAGNRGGNNPSTMSEITGGTVISAGHNLIGVNTNVTSQFPAGNPNANNDRVGTSAAPLNPRLAPLGNYGGTTLTHALLSNSPAIKNGSNAIAEILVTDQRGATRVVNVDVGAFELNNIFTAVAPPARVGQNYNLIITSVSGGFTYSVTGGQLPPGLSLATSFASFSKTLSRESNNGEMAPSAVVALTGMPTMSGTYNFTITSTDGVNSNATNYQIVVAAGPTAALAKVGGRVLTSDGRGIRSVQVSMTDSQGNTRTALSSSFGYYQFSDVPVGGTYIISVSSKKFTFSQPVQVRSIQEDTGDINFITEN